MQTADAPFIPSTPAIRSWLTLCALLVAAMVLIGGATRLSESGLSIVHWKLVSGILPPLSDADWQHEFAAYKTSPQFRYINPHFGLGDFRHIFWLEYLHRLLGRITALTFILPLLYFAARKQVSAPLAKRMASAFLLIALQGAIGWVMVASGLVNEPHVDPAKLALHLALAFALFALLLWTRWDMGTRIPRLSGVHGVAIGLRLLMALTVLQIIMGALVAGSHAGYIYNTFPLMQGAFLPPQALALFGHWHAHFVDALVIQFQHRMGAYLVAFSTFALAAYGWTRTPYWRMLRALVSAVTLQFLLGVATLLLVVDPLLAEAHQFMALLFFGLLLRVIYAHRLDPA